MTTLLNLEGVLDRKLARQASKKTRQNNKLAPDLDVDGTERSLETHCDAASQPDRPQEAAIKPFGVAESGPQPARGRPTPQMLASA
jgi:hypothetical protein